MNRPLMVILSDPGFWVIFGVFFFLGLTMGWFCRKGSLFWIFVSIFIFAPLLEFIMQVDVWIFTVPFVLGFLVHTAKPLWRKLF